MYGPPGDFNPIKDWDYTTGTFGLLYESLFLYNPLNDKFTPWLAQSGSLDRGQGIHPQAARGPEVDRRRRPSTADDVVYTVNLGKLASVPYSTLWSFLSGATKVDATHGRSSRSRRRNYQEWSTWLYNTAIVPEHLWKGRTETEVMGNNDTGPDRVRPVHAADL